MHLELFNQPNINELELTEQAKQQGVTHIFEEVRADDWGVVYDVFEDKVEATEYMGINDKYSFETAETIEKILEITSKWC